MKSLSYSKVWFISASLLWAVLAGICSDAVAKKMVVENDRTTETREMGINLGKDVHAYETAREMYQTAQPSAYDNMAELLVELITEGLQAGDTLEDQHIRRSLLELNPCRQTAQVQAAATDWVTLAVRGIEAAFAPDPPAPEILARANRAYQQGEFLYAASQYRSLLQQAPDNRDARNNLALTYLRLGRDLLAQIEFETLRQFAPDYLPAQINAAAVYNQLGQPEKAETLTTPIPPAVQHFLGDSRTFSGPVGASEYDEQAQRLVNTITKNLEAKTLLEEYDISLCLFELNPCRYEPEVQEAAVKWAKRATAGVRKTAAYDDTTAIMMERANSNYESGGLLSACMWYGKILKATPGNPDARNNLALTYLHLGYDLAALVELETLKRMNSQYVPALINLTVLYERFGRTDKARALAYKLQRDYQNVPAAAFNAAWYLHLKGIRTDARRVLEPFIEMNPGPKYRQLYDLSGGQD